jgi:hypothetical protein
MSRASGPIHVPGFDGKPICGSTTGSVSVAALPTCPLCQKRSTPGGIKAEDIYNPAHPVGRIVMGSTFDVPGFPKVPGTKNPFGKG